MNHNTLPTDKSTPPAPPTDSPPVVLWIGLDWADKEHHLVGLPVAGGLRLEHKLAQKPETLEQWILNLRRQYPSGRFGVCVEQSRGPLIAALLKYDFVQIYPINPRCLADYRRAFCLSGAKSDPTDADLLADLGLKHSDRLHPLLPQDPLTRQLAMLVEARRDFVEDRTALSNRLGAALKGYFPLALELLRDRLDTPMALEFLRRWPNLEQLKGARPDIIRAFFYAHHSRSEELIQSRLQAIATSVSLTQDPALIEPLQLQALSLGRQIAALQKVIADYDQRIAALFARHPHARLFESLPGAGPTLAPRLAVLFGTLTANWEHAQDLICFTGIAPVRKQSGQQSTVHFRWVRPKFIHQSVVEFAKCSIAKCPWARLLYDDLIARGKGRWMAIRVIAFKWLRILWRCWKDRTLYDEQRYLRSLQKRDLNLYASILHASAPNDQTVV